MKRLWIEVKKILKRFGSTNWILHSLNSSWEVNRLKKKTFCFWKTDELLIFLLSQRNFRNSWKSLNAKEAKYLSATESIKSRKPHFDLLLKSWIVSNPLANFKLQPLGVELGFEKNVPAFSAYLKYIANNLTRRLNDFSNELVPRRRRTFVGVSIVPKSYLTDDVIS